MKAYICKLNVLIYRSPVALNVAHSIRIKSKYDSFYLLLKFFHDRFDTHVLQ